MTPELWQRLKPLFNTALEEGAEDRTAFVDRACGDDLELKRHLKELLDAEEQNTGSIDERFADLNADFRMPLSGQKLGPYVILSPLGRGGMGEVWRAHDSRLGRDVAIKISHQQFSDRFEREARAVASLNHPHICQLYDVGPNYLVMEFIEGTPLKGPMPLNQALPLAIQLLDAMDAAHCKCITHRDLKPGNVLLTKSGVKVLDFGLAKMTMAQGVTAGNESITYAPTQQGTILGTLQYMAPEQLQGNEDVDSRADIFSFGCVLYEMLTGKRAFEGANTASVIAAIMDRPAPSVAAVAPASLDWVLRRCLEKDPDKRWQSARDLGAALERVAVVGTEVQGTRRQWRGGALPWAAAALGIAAAGGLAFVHLRDKPPESPMVRLNLQPPANYRFGEGTPPAISPDGRKIVFEAVSAQGQRQLWLRPLDSLTSQPLAGTEGGSYPFWSPDNSSIGFFAAGKLKKMDASGGPATTLADALTPRGGTWSRKGVIVFSPTPYRLMQVPAAGGEPQPATNFEGKAATRFPFFLPDGTHFLYLTRRTAQSQLNILIGSLASPTEERVLSEAADSFAIYSKGYLVFMKGTTLVARPFDEKRLEFTGEPVSVAEHVKLSAGITQLGEFSGSANGDLVYQGGMGNLRLTWLDRAGKHLGTLGDPGPINGMQFSPDHKTAAVQMRDTGGNVDVWLFDTSRGLRTRITSDAAYDNAPAWSPDGRTIVFRSNRNGPFDLYRKPADGSRNEELLYADNLLKGSLSFSPDGKYLAYFAQGDPKTGTDIWILPDPLGTPGAMKPYPFLRTEYDESNPQFSPDGRRIAYNSNESGRNEVYVTPFPGPGAKRQVSPAGGTEPRWRADGKELFYLAPDDRLTVAEVDLKAGAVEVKKITPLFGPVTAGYGVSADGQRFLTALPPDGEVAEPLTVVLNWTSGLKK
jgi:serine/threonine protein kinase